jgi:hypothetical protein
MTTHNIRINALTCRVCGAENAYLSKKTGMGMCRACDNASVSIVDRATFDAAIWNDPNEPNPPRAIMRDFYDDYRHSGLSLSAYLQSTTTET